MSRNKILLFILIFLSITLRLPAAEIMPLSEVKEGMIGVGRTVFHGNKIEEFQVEIIGILKNFAPQQDLILGLLKGSKLEETGVIAGMSGSPVYINGKMIGAVAYSWPFAKTPIAGITPIESMLETQVLPSEQPPLTPPIEIAEYYNFEKMLTGHAGAASPVASAHVPGYGQIQLSPIAFPLSVSGFDSRTLDRFQSLFSAFGLQPMQGGASFGTDLSLPDSDLQPGAPISVQLIKGDFDIGAIGTVTYRDAEKVLAFGHPFFNLGPIDLPMATAKIFTVVPSLHSSFKVGSAGPTVGSIRQDLHSAVFGIMGRNSSMIPVTLNLTNEKKIKRSFHFEVANNKLLSPLLIDFAFQNSILVTQLGYSESTLKVSGQIGIKGSPPVQIGNIFSGAGSFTDASQYVAAIVYMLMTNEFKNVDVEEVEIDVDSAMKRNEAELVEVWLDRNEARPGDEIKLRAVYRPLLGEKKVEEFAIRLPDDLRAGMLNFIVGGGQEISRQEFAQYGKNYEASSFDQILALLNSLRSDDRIYVRAFRPEPGLILKGQPLQSLPPSVLSALSSSQTIGSSQRVGIATLLEESRGVDYHLTGTRLFTLRILPQQN